MKPSSSHGSAQARRGRLRDLAGELPWHEDRPTADHVLLSPAVFESRALRDPVRFRAWSWLLFEAAPAEYTVRIARRPHVVRRGDVLTSEARLAAAWGMSRPAVQRFLVSLEQEGMISRERGRFGSKISIIGYDADQPAADAGEGAQL